jgi:putative methionine-R-sulfoxide reductase with GAF domain
VLESSAPSIGSLSVDSGFMKTLVGQLSNAFFFHQNLTRYSLMFKLLTTFFNTGLKPYECLRELAMRTVSFLPSYGSFRLTPNPEVQILFYDDEDSYLTIKATTGVELPTERVAVKDSVCGYLVEKRELSYYLCNPQNESRYKWYLGRKKGKEMLSELSVPLHHDGNLVAVLNLESEQENAFKQIHIDACIEFTHQVEEWIFVIKERIKKDWLRQMATTEATERYLDGAINAINHDIKNDVFRVTSPINEIIDIINGEKEKYPKLLLEESQKARENLNTLNKNIWAFLEEIKYISKQGDYSIASLITQTIDIVKMAYRIEFQAGQIQIIFNDCDFHLYCSPAIKLHFYEFFQNSIFWIKKELRRNSSHVGTIQITVALVPESVAQQEKTLNKRAQIIIRDNGPGVSHEILEKLRRLEPGYTLRDEEGGSGYGFFAAKEYLSSIGGWLKLDSKEGEFFEVNIILDIYNPQIHAC